MQKDILLVAVNARYTHTSLALRSLYANFKELKSISEIIEFTIGENAQSIAESILIKNPKIVALSTYIWNAQDISDIVEVIKKVSPITKVVLGGPEVSYYPFRVDFDLADYIIQGEGEISFYKLCKDLINSIDPTNRIIKSELPNLKEIELPYRYYSDDDIKNRYIYVETSRGCPFECEFCLSAIDERVRIFDIDKVLGEFDNLWSRGARNFKFIDRTFNLNIKLSIKIIDFFLDRIDDEFMLHFEVIPDNFPARLREKILQFPPHKLQFEIGIQTLNLNILENISRVMNLDRLKENISFLENESNAHLHLDLIVGLPNETLESFGKNLNYLTSISTSEIQIGILKKLSGTKISRHDETYGMVYSNKPPYDILKNNQLSFLDIQKMKRFARFWDLVYNSGNFHKTAKYIWKDSTVFDGFYDFSEWIYSQTLSTWKISLNRLSQLLFDYLVEVKGFDKKIIAKSVLEDIIKVDGRAIPQFVRDNVDKIPDLRQKNISKYNKRQLLRGE